MDEDAKTLLAILALVYGSSNGLGLLKEALDPVKKETNAIEEAMKDPRAATTYIGASRKTLLGTLLSFEVVIYVVLVIILPLFLALVLWFGAQNALAVIGLGSSAIANGARRGSPFYWILLALSLVSSTHLLSAYLKGWRWFLKAWNWKPPSV